MAEARQELALPTSSQARPLIRVNPEVLSDETKVIETGITIRHGESVITLPGGSTAQSIADLVKALNRHV